MAASPTRFVKRTSVFPAPKRRVFELITKFETLSKVAWPYISFTPVNGDADLEWREGETFSFVAKLVGIIPFGTHTIEVIQFGEDRIFTNEGNARVPVWNHEVILTDLGNGTTEYTDQIEIGAGWKTIFVYWWAKAFYAHRQRKWIKLLTTGAFD